MTDILIISPDAVFARMAELVLSPLSDSIRVCKSVHHTVHAKLIIADTKIEGISQYIQGGTCVIGIVSDKAEQTDRCDKALVRPISEKELRETAKALLYNSSEAPSELAFDAAVRVGDSSLLSIDPHSKTVSFGGDVAALTDKELAVILCLLDKKGEAVSRAEIVERVWGGGRSPSECDVYIRFIRKKIDEKFGIKTIYSVRNKGYMIK